MVMSQAKGTFFTVLQNERQTTLTISPGEKSLLVWSSIQADFRMPSRPILKKHSPDDLQMVLGKDQVFVPLNHPKGNRIIGNIQPYTWIH